MKERTKNLAQTTENLNILNKELKDLNILNQELARKFFLRKMPAVTSEFCFENLIRIFSISALGASNQNISATLCLADNFCL